MTAQSTFAFTLDSAAVSGSDQRLVVPLRVLVACESSGTVRDAFNALGHVATSCDMLETQTPGDHYAGDVRDILGVPCSVLFIVFGGGAKIK